MAESPKTQEKHSRSLDSATKYDYVRFTWSDLHGIARCRCIPRDHVLKALEHGIGVGTVTNIFGYKCKFPEKFVVNNPEILRIIPGNYLYRAQEDTVKRLAWCGGTKLRSVGEVLCEATWPDGSPEVMDPRYLARKQLEALKEHGYEFMSSFEMEFILLDKETRKPMCDEGFGGHGSSLAFSAQEDVLIELCDKMKASGINISCMHAEYVPGQYELTLDPAMGIEAVDASFRAREAILEICHQRNILATFMSKSTPSEMGSGFHFNHSLWKTGKDDEKLTDGFFDLGGENKMSDVARYWIGGILKHASALTAICCPTISCYMRFHRPFIMSHAAWGLDDRDKTLRMMVGGPGRTYLENRLPSSTCNPYLVLAAMVAAGIDGLINKYEPHPAPEPGGHPASDAAELPHTLEDALTALEKDDVLVEALGPRFIHMFTGVKRVTEVEPFKDVKVDEDREEDYEKLRDFYLTML